jgi:hypothetical protein
MRRPSSNVYEYAIRSFPILCFTGFAILVLSAFTEWRWAMKVGTALFVSGFVVWGFANGGAFVWGFVRTVRRFGFSNFVKHPWSSLFYISLMVFFLSAGVFSVWLILRPYILSK